MEYYRDRLIYFAHPINTYNTDTENEAIAVIKSSLDYAILNPNKQEHQDAYTKQGMQYFLDLVTTCVALIAMPFPDGKYGHGVYNELEVAHNRMMPIYSISNNVISRLYFDEIEYFSIEETKERLNKIVFDKDL